MPYKLIWVNGNAFAIMWYVKNAMYKEWLWDKVEEYLKQAQSWDYDNLLCVSQDYIDKINSLSSEIIE